MTRQPDYERGDVKLYLGDCLEILPGLEAGSVDCVVTSPPYNQLGERMPAKPSGMHAENKWVTNTRLVGYADDMPENEYQEWLNCALGFVAKCCRDGGSIFVNHKCRWRETVLLHPIKWIDIPGARLRQEIIWRRAGSTTLNARMYAPNDERILWWVNGKARWHWNQPSTTYLSVWDITQDNEANGHPCPFPEEIPHRCIMGTTDVGGVVCDPFLGSGTTAIACIRTGRKFIGIELEPKYFEIAVKRIDAELDRLALFDPVAPATRRQAQMEFTTGNTEAAGQ